MCALVMAHGSCFVGRIRCVPQSHILARSKCALYRYFLLDQIHPNRTGNEDHTQTHQGIRRFVFSIGLLGSLVNLL